LAQRGAIGFHIRIGGSGYFDHCLGRLSIVCVAFQGERRNTTISREIDTLAVYRAQNPSAAVLADLEADDVLCRLVEKYRDFDALPDDCTQQAKGRTIRLCGSRGRHRRDDRRTGKGRMRPTARGGEQWALDRYPQIGERNAPQGISFFRASLSWA
jgi:hypothetical protein